MPAYLGRACRLPSMKISVAFPVLLFLSVPPVLGAPPERGEDSQNPAVKYLRADASLRQSFPLPTDAAAKLQKALESPLDDQDEKLVAAAGGGLREIQKGPSHKNL